MLTIWLFVATGSVPAWGQYTSTSEKLLASAKHAGTWVSGQTNIVQLEGPVSIELDDLKLTADNAVIWMSPAPGGLLQEQQANIALIGNATLVATDNHVTRSGPRLLVTSVVRGTIRLTTDDSNRSVGDLSDSPLYKQAQAIRAQTEVASETAAPPATTQETTASTAGAPPTTLTSSEKNRTAAASGMSPDNAGEEIPQLLQNPDLPAIPAPTLPLQGQRRLPTGVGLAPQPATRGSGSSNGEISFHAPQFEQSVDANDNVVVILTGGVTVTQNRDNGDFLELIASKVVLFTSEKNEQMKNVDLSAMGRKFTAGYLEGDVQVNFTPASVLRPEQRMTADRVYYDFVTDRAVLTGVVLHTIDPQQQIPIIVRAEKMHQLAQGEYTARGAEMTTSSFATPSYSVRAGYAYLHQVPTPSGQNNDFVSTNNTARLFGFPLFYFPFLSGTINNDAFPLRDFSFGTSRIFGTQVATEWGLFETLGLKRPQDLDVGFRVSNYSARGMGGGIDGYYGGNYINETTLNPWSFSGDFTGYYQADKGVDNLGGARALVQPPTENRGVILWEHQHFFPDDFQVQIRAGYVSDPTYLEEYYRDRFDENLPYNFSLNVKRQRDSEAITFVTELDTTNFITNSDRQQEQFDVERAPEVGYHLIGESIADDDLTLFTNDSASRLRMNSSRASLLAQGYYPGLSPGIPTDGFTGISGKWAYRDDVNAELDWPFAAGEFKVVPYVYGRENSYSDSPSGSVQNRLYTGAGLRMSTAFWKIDESAESDLLDIHRLRHIIEPEVNLYSSASTLDNSKLFIYDPDVDGINDITAAQIALHQRWETMRGGPDRWRSVDLFELNVEGNFFLDKPPPGVLNPVQFRGLFFPSTPYASVPRQGVNADASWRISDTTSFLASEEWNLDQREQATASAGFSVSRDERVSYYFGDTYIQPLNSQVVSGVAEYKLTSKYTLQIGQSFNFGDTHDINTVVSLIRRFDTFSISVSVYHDAVTNLSGFNFNLIPLGLRGLNGGLTGLTGQ
jgi:lipopolysaccharide export system protein LptA